MRAREKTAEIFRELVGAKAERLASTHFPADVSSRIADALSKSSEAAGLLKADHIAFHLVDWQADGAFLVALTLFPERFSADEIRDGIEEFLAHAPAHVLAAARLNGTPVADLLEDEVE